MIAKSTFRTLPAVCGLWGRARAHASWARRPACDWRWWNRRRPRGSRSKRRRGAANLARHARDAQRAGFDRRPARRRRADAARSGLRRHMRPRLSRPPRLRHRFPRPPCRSPTATPRPSRWRNAQQHPVFEGIHVQHSIRAGVDQGRCQCRRASSSSPTNAQVR